MNKLLTFFLGKPQDAIAYEPVTDSISELKKMIYDMDANLRNNTNAKSVILFCLND